MEHQEVGAGESGAPLDAQVIVVGSGFGGAVTACRLAQAGFDVLVLERGRRYESNDFPALPVAPALLPDLQRWTWQRGQGLWDVVDLDEIVSVQAAGYGGGSLIYANVHLRPPGEIFDDGWPAAYRGGRALDKFYDLAGHMLEVEPVSAHPELQRTLVKSDQLCRAASHLGRDAFHPPLAIRYADGPNLHGVAQQACNGCGNCCTGCPHGAKNTLDANYLAVAERHGARAATQCEVIGLRHLGPAGWEARCLDHLRAAEVTLRARHVFLCAGSIHSTRLLARAHLPESARATQRLVGTGYFPGGDAIGLVYDTAHEQFPSHGPTITTAVAHWDAEAPGSFFLVEDGGYGSALERIMGLLRAPAWVGRNRLSVAGKGAVAPSPIPAPQGAPPAPGGGVPSPVDALVDALARGAFRPAVSTEVRRAFDAFVGELETPLLFPAVVDATLGRALRERYARTWLVNRLDPDGPLLRFVTRAVKWLAYGAFGDPRRLAGHALRAMLALGDLPRAEIARQVLGVDAAGAERRAMFLCMGRDAAAGVLQYDARRDRLVADLDLFTLAPGYAREERLMTDLARALGGELRTNPAWTFLGKPITVHNQGGCRMSDSPTEGVTTDEGAVRGCDGLYVCDGALLCGSVGANPSATILAIAERNALAFIRRHRAPSWPDGDASAGAAEYRRHRQGAAAWAARASAGGWSLAPPRAPSVALGARPLGIRFHEVMQGYHEPTTERPRDDGRYREHETAGCPEYPLRLDLDVEVEDLAAFFQDERHRMRLTGTVSARLPGARALERCSARGSLELMVPRFKPHAIAPDDAARRHAQAAAARRPYTARRGPPGGARERFMKYELEFRDGAGRAWRLRGFKRISREQRVDAWRATSSLFCQLHGPFPPGDAPQGRHALAAAGVVHVDLTSFLFQQLPSVEVTGTDDPARRTWALAAFSAFFFGTLQRIYVPGLGPALDAVLRAQLGDARPRPV